MEKTLRNLVLTGTLAALGLAGCGSERPIPLIVEHNLQSAKGYDILIEHSKKSPKLIRIGKMVDGEYYFRGPVVSAVNYDGDFRFDEITIFAPEGDPIEDFASLKEIHRIYKEVMIRQNKLPSNTK